MAFGRVVCLFRSKLGEEAQGNPRGLLVDANLRVKGRQGSIIAIGDAAITNQVCLPQLRQMNNCASQCSS